jgi:uncharacterized protein
MNKLDPTGESLESILASIRRGLAEQSTDILADDGAPQPVALDMLGAVVPGEDAPPRFLGNGGAEAPPQPESTPPGEIPLPTEAPAATDRAFAGLDDPPPPASIRAALSRLTGEPLPAPAAVATSPQPAEASKDPLWFLGRGKDPAPTPSVSAQPAAPAGMTQPPAAAPKPSLTESALKEIVRGPLPPFFGSSPEATKVEVSPAPPTPGPLRLPDAVIPPAAPPAAAARPSDAERSRGAVPDGAPRASASVGAAVPAGAAAREGAPNGKAHSLSVQPSGDSAPPTTATPPGADTPQLQGLDAMVADLLRPMLRRWLDENMPRLVSAALKAEAETLSKRDPKKP